MFPSTVAPRRLAKIGACVLVVFVLLTIALYTQPHLSSSVPTFFKSHRHDHDSVHVIIPSTSTNPGLCKLLISAAVLGYNATTLLNFGDYEWKDEFKQHITKITGTIDYVNSLPPEKQDDLILMLDAFDTWFQLPPEILIKRYHEIVAKAGRFHVDDFGAENIAAHHIRNTVIFGSDKENHPAKRESASYWAVPDAWLPQLVFGPNTDNSTSMYDRPRWLNSGSIMGPAREVRDVCMAALDCYRQRTNIRSDQFHYSQVFGTQSYARRLIKLEYDRARGRSVIEEEEFLKPKSKSGLSRQIPDIAEGMRTEFHIGVDSQSSLVQTGAYSGDYLTWVRNNDSSLYVRERSKHSNPHHHFSLPRELEGYGPIPEGEEGMDPALYRWERLPLATNTASKNIPVVLHVNGKKGYRELWWPRSWFYPFLEQLLQRARDNGLRDKGMHRDALAGAWTLANGTRGWVAWKNVCGEFEDVLVGRAKH